MSGKDRAKSSSPLPLKSGRITRNSRKAATLLSSCSSPSLESNKISAENEASSLDTHPPSPEGYLSVNLPVQEEPIILESTPITSRQSSENLLPTLSIPSIRQLRDFPNTSVPLPSLQGPSVIVTLPNSAPTSPSAYSQSGCSIQTGEPLTPATSPQLGISVILSNPTFKPVEPVPILRVSTPVESLGGSPRVGSWDNFHENPTYQQHDDQFWVSRDNYQQKIPIVSTDLSDLETSETSLNDLDLNCFSTVRSSQIQKTMVVSSMEVSREQAESDIKSLENKVKDACEDLDPELITEFTAPHMGAKLNNINTAKDQYRTAVRGFLDKFKNTLTEPVVNQWQADMKSLLSFVRNHESVVFTKITQVTAKPPEMTEFEKASLEIQKKQLAMQQKTIESQKQEVLATADPLRKNILEKCNSLDSELELITVTQLKEGDEHQVTRTMLKLADWKSQMETVSTLLQDLLTKTAIHQLDSSQKAEVTAAVARTKSMLESIIATAEEEDLNRQLYSLDTSQRGEQVKWPSFSGEAGEDFYKFKKDFYDAAKANRTSLKNQTTKLRENLRGYAKSLVAASVTDVDKAFKILENACGDTMDVVNFRVNNLLKVGQWPAEGTRDCYTKQVRWLVKVQALIQEIIDLADTEEELAAVIYNREKLTQIMRLFPPFMVDKLGAIPGYKKEKYLAVIKKLDDWKTISQNREKIYGTSSSSNQDRAQTKSATPAQIPSGHTN